MKRSFSLIAAAGAFLALIVWNAPAKEGAAWGAQLFVSLLLPSLLPFFVLTNLLNRLGLPEALEGRLAGLTERCFSLPGAAAAALIPGLCGGYPLGAAAAAGLCESGKLTKEETERLLFFCDNTGPAFAVAAMGGGALGSVRAGVLLWICHVLSALLLGLLCRRRGKPEQSRETDTSPAPAPLPIPKALTESVTAAGSAMLNVGFFVVFFSSLLYVLDAAGLLTALSRALAGTGLLPEEACRCLVWSFFELSGSVGLLSALPLTPSTLAVASFALSWGGLCVCCQSAAVTAPAGLSARTRLQGKLLHGLLAAALAYIMSTLFFALSPAILS